MTRTLILPGLHDSDPGHWQSRWEARDETLLRVIQDDWETPHCADWIARLDQALTLTGPDTVLVAHSAGCALVAHWAVGESSRRVRGALLVAPSDPEAPSFPSGPTGFAPIPMLRLRFRSIIVASSNDPYVTLSRAQTFAMAWGSEFIMIGEAGHINSASGLGDWAEGLALLNTLLKTSKKISAESWFAMNKFRKRKQTNEINGGQNETERDETRNRSEPNQSSENRVTAGVGGCAPATAREGEGADPRP